jgi:hypothetical protein
VVEDAGFKTKRQPKRTTVIKLQAQHLAIFEKYVLKSGFRKFYQAYVAANEFTVCKQDIGKICI